MLLVLAMSEDVDGHILTPNFISLLMEILGLRISFPNSS
jgi:hypothetical protein